MLGVCVGGTVVLSVPVAMCAVGCSHGTRALSCSQWHAGFELFSWHERFELFSWHVCFELFSVVRGL